MHHVALVLSLCALSKNLRCIESTGYILMFSGALFSTIR